MAALRMLQPGLHRRQHQVEAAADEIRGAVQAAVHHAGPAAVGPSGPQALHRWLQLRQPLVRSLDLAQRGAQPSNASRTPPRTSSTASAAWRGRKVDEESRVDMPGLLGARPC